MRKTVYVKAEVVSEDKETMVVRIKNGFGEPHIFTDKTAVLRQDTRDGSLIALTAAAK